MEQQIQMGQGKHVKLREWFGGSKRRRAAHVTLFLTICVWLLLQMMSNPHGGGYSNPSGQHRLLDSGKSSRRLLSRRWIWEDERNEAAWDIVAHHHDDEERVTRKEDGGGAGDDEFDGDNEEDVERMVKLAKQATSDFSSAVSEVSHVVHTFQDVTGTNGVDGDDDDVVGRRGNSTEDGGGIDSELQEFFEIENSDNN